MHWIYNTIYNNDDDDDDDATMTMKMIMMMMTIKVEKIIVIILKMENWYNSYCTEIEVGLVRMELKKLAVLILSKAKMNKGTVSFCVDQWMLVLVSMA